MADGFSEMVGSTKINVDQGGESPKSADDISSLTEKFSKGHEENVKKKDAALEEFKSNLTKMSGEYDEAMKKVGSIERPKVPKAEKLPDAPDSQYKDPTQALGSIASILMILGSLKTRAPMTSALNAGAAAMEAFHKGDQESVKLEREKWHDNLEKGLKQHQEEMNEYYAELEAKNFDLRAAQPMFRAIAANHQNQIMLAKIEMGKLDDQDTYLKDMFQAGVKATESLWKSKEHSEQVRLAHEDRQAQIQATRENAQAQTETRKEIAEMMWGGGASNSGLTPEGDKVYNEFVKSGIPIPKTMRGRIDVDRLNKLGAEQEGGAGSGSIAGGRADYRAKASALAANTKDLVTIRPYKDMLDRNVNIAKDLSKKITRTNSALANKPINWLRTHMSDDPDIGEYLFQINTVQTEAARVLNNPRLVGQLTDSARQDMQNVVSGNMPLEMTDRIFERMKIDGSNRVDALVKENESLKKDLSGGSRPSPPQEGGRRSSDPQPLGSGQETKVLNGKTYTKINGKWFEQ